MSTVIDTQFRDALDQAMASLVSAEYGPMGAMVRLPIRYPSGSFVVLQVSETGDKCFVTDYGMGQYLELEMAGAERSFDASLRLRHPVLPD